MSTRGQVVTICYRCAGERIINGRPCLRCNGSGVDPNP
jgi:hypothetical protein